MSPFFSTLFTIMIFVIWYAYERNKITRIAEKKSELFWETERKANATRKKPLNDLVKITIPLDTLLVMPAKDEKLAELQEYITTLSQKDIINLTGISNTDLKLTYGAPNFSYLSACDQNFTELARTLNQMAKRLLELEMEPEAQKVLEFAVECKTDVSTTYEMLSGIYAKKKQGEKILQLIDVVETLNTLLKPKILADLEKAYVNAGSGFEDIFD